MFITWYHRVNIFMASHGFNKSGYRVESGESPSVIAPISPGHKGLLLHACCVVGYDVIVESQQHQLPPCSGSTQD